jgi:hypothetical protein
VRQFDRRESAVRLDGVDLFCMLIQVEIIPDALDWMICHIGILADLGDLDRHSSPPAFCLHGPKRGRPRGQRETVARRVRRGEKTVWGCDWANPDRFEQKIVAHGFGISRIRRSLLSPMDIILQISPSFVNLHQSIFLCTALEGGFT